MAFVTLPSLISARHPRAQTCGPQRSITTYAASRKSPPRRRRHPPPRDPILDDDDVDMTSVRTFVSCPSCANSLMVKPEAFLPKGSVALNCNVCERRVAAKIEELETVSGENFDGARFMARFVGGVGTEVTGD